MYYVSDECQKCGLYECAHCHNRFLEEKIAEMIDCPYCDGEIDLEIGPDEEMPELEKSAKLLQIIEGKDEILKYDTLLSLAITGGDPDTWL